MSKHNDIGKIGEEIALTYLQNKGFKILATNWKYNNYEIDIIAQIPGYLVIVEVKTRSANDFENPEDAVNIKKQKRLINAANEFIFYRNIKLETRFDIISIVISGDEPIIEHIQDAFYPL